jgi:GT2 family glycosyltransferase
VDLSIVVVNWNTRELLRACLESIRETVDGLTYEAIVVDNASTDGSAELVRTAFPWVRLIVNQANLGFARANNQALHASRGRFVLLLNSDARLLGRAAAAMVELLEANPRAAAVGGKLLNPDGSFQSSYMDFPSLAGELLLLTGLSRWLLPPTYPSHAEAASHEPRQVDWVSGALLMVRRQALEDVGLLDERFFMYTEEVDWCFRMRRRGWAVHYLPAAEAIHHGGGSSGRVPRPKRAQLYASKWRYLRKHHSAGQARLYRGLVRLFSRLKLLAWFSTTLSPDPSRRALGREQVASYRYLLERF